MKRFKKLLGMLLISTSSICFCIVGAISSSFNGFLTRADIPYTHCGAYDTNEDWNISREEVIQLTTFEDTYQQIDDAKVKNCSDIISSVTSTKGSFIREESGKQGTNTLKFGTASAKGSITFSLTKKIDAIGFYADAYDNSHDKNNKKLLVNDIETKVLGSSYVYDLSDNNQRFFIEFSSSTSEVTISAAATSNNRFHIYSIGFYSKYNFPEAGGDTPEPETQTVTFTAGTDTGATSVTKEGITITMSTMSRTDNYRVYADTDLSISSTVGNMTNIEITCTGSGTSNYGPGKLSGTGYTASSGKTGTWTGSSTSITLHASSQARITKIVITIG